MKTALSLVAVSLLLTACASQKVLEITAFNPQAEDAPKAVTLHVPGTVYVHAIDGSKDYLPPSLVAGIQYQGAKIRLLPGKHNLSVSYNINNYAESKGITGLPVKLEEGKDYFVTINQSKQGDKEYIHYGISECGSALAIAIDRESKKMSELLSTPYRQVCSNQQT